MKTPTESDLPPVHESSQPPPEYPEYSYASDAMTEVIEEWGDERIKRKYHSPQDSSTHHDENSALKGKSIPQKKMAPERPNQAEEITQLCESNVSDFILDQFSRPHVRIRIDDHFELWTTSDERFSTWLARLYRKCYRKPPDERALKQAQKQIDAMCYEKQSQTLNNRVARIDDKILYDLTNQRWQCVEITSEGFNIVSQPPIFRRFIHQKPQVFPTKTGAINKLWDFMNVPEDKRTVLAVLIATWFIPDIAHPILILTGEPGTGKSTISRLLKQLVDPSAITSLGAPKNSNEAYQMFDHCWLTPLDNLNNIPSWLSDSLCRVVTGEGSIHRKLYTNDGVFIRFYRRCLILNGIGNPVNQADLLDRAIVIELDPIESKRTDHAINEAWAIAIPGILSSIFKSISTAIEVYPSISETNLPRMADFAKWGQAIAEGLGFTREKFLDDYLLTIDQKWSDKIEDSPLATEIIRLVNDNDGRWEGTRSELCEEIKLEENKNKAYWPKSPQGVSKELTRLNPALKKHGIIIKRTKMSAGKRIIRIFQVDDTETDELPF